MPSLAAFLADFQNAAEIAGKRHLLSGWPEAVLRATLTRNRVALMNEPDPRRCRQLLSGSILIRCELARRQANAALGDAAPAPDADAAVPRFG